MSANDRLQQLQSALSGRGVLDVKFCFGPVEDLPASDVSNGVAAFLQKYVAGQGVPLEAIGDSTR